MNKSLVVYYRYTSSLFLPTALCVINCTQLFGQLMINKNRVIIMKTCKLLLICCILLGCSKEEIELLRRYEGLTLGILASIPDSLKTADQNELHLNLLRVFHTNIEFFGDSLNFLLDRYSFLSEGLPESAYWDYLEYLNSINIQLRNASSIESRQITLSRIATINAAYRKYFGYEYSGDVPIHMYRNISKQGEVPNFLPVIPIRAYTLDEWNSIKDTIQ